LLRHIYLVAFDQIDRRVEDDMLAPAHTGVHLYARAHRRCRCGLVGGKRSPEVLEDKV
jgi:hypothetical protein